MKTVIIFALSAMLVGCFGRSTTKDANTKDSVVTVGADRDAHGCIGSAGYVWCEVVGDCVRPWEAGIQLDPMIKDTTSAVLVAYIVFSKDNKKVELFAPGAESKILTADGSVWTAGNTTLELRNGSYEILRQGQVMYKGKK